MLQKVRVIEICVTFVRVCVFVKLSARNLSGTCLHPFPFFTFLHRETNVVYTCLLIVDGAPKQAAFPILPIQATLLIATHVCVCAFFVRAAVYANDGCTTDYTSPAPSTGRGSGGAIVCVACNTLAYLVDLWGFVEPFFVCCFHGRARLGRMDEKDGRMYGDKELNLFVFGKFYDDTFALYLCNSCWSVCRGGLDISKGSRTSPPTLHKMHKTVYEHKYANINTQPTTAQMCKQNNRLLVALYSTFFDFGDLLCVCLLLAVC